MPATADTATTTNLYLPAASKVPGPLPRTLLTVLWGHKGPLTPEGHQTQTLQRHEFIQFRWVSLQVYWTRRGHGHPVMEDDVSTNQAQSSNPSTTYTGGASLESQRWKEEEPAQTTKDPVFWFLGHSPLAR